MSEQAQGANPLGEMVKLAVAAQERSMQLAQSWSDALLTTFKEQADDAQANLSTLAASLEAMERALASQEETNRAIRQSLEGYREIIDRLTAAQERNARMVQTAVDGLRSATQGQLEAARALLTPPPSMTAASEPFTELLTAWNAAFTRMLEAGLPARRGSAST
jgi:hypothetical protein